MKLARRNEGADPARGGGGQRIALSASFGSLDQPARASEQVGSAVGYSHVCLDSLETIYRGGRHFAVRIGLVYEFFYLN